MTVSRDTARKITAEIEAAIAPILAKHGLDKPKLSSNYGPLYRLRIETTPVVLSDTGVNTASLEAEAYERYRDSYMLRPGLLGNTVILNGQPCKFLGIATKRRKFPFLFELPNGQKVFHTDIVRERLNATATS